MAPAAYIVTSATRLDPDNPEHLTYAAVADNPEAALKLVRALVADNAELEAKGATLSPAVAMALGLKPGSARLV